MLSRSGSLLRSQSHGLSGGEMVELISFHFVVLAVLVLRELVVELVGS